MSTLTTCDNDLECTSRRIMDTLSKHCADSTPMNDMPNYYSISTPPQFRHVPIELAHLPSGWIIGLQGIRSYYDISRLHWRRSIYIRPETLVVNPVEMTVTCVIEAHWEWRNPNKGLPWVEVAQGKLWYDHDFKVKAEEHLTISGKDTYFLSRGKLLRKSHEVSRQSCWLCL